MMGNLFGVSKQKIFVKKFLVLGSKNARNDIFYSKLMSQSIKHTQTFNFTIILAIKEKPEATINWLN